MTEIERTDDGKVRFTSLIATDPHAVAIQQTEARLGVKLTTAQYAAAYAMLREFWTFMPPGRGAGKTFLLDFLREALGE